MCLTNYTTPWLEMADNCLSVTEPEMEQFIFTAKGL